MVLALDTLGKLRGRPAFHDFRAAVSRPGNDSNWPDSHNLAQPLGLRIEVRMPQKTPREGRHFILVRFHDGKAIVAMTESLLIETRVAGKEGRVPQRAKFDNDLFILETLLQEVITDLADCESSGFEQLPLAIEDVFVEDDQARTRSSEYSEAAYWPA